MSNSGLVLSIREAAAELGLCSKSVETLCREGKLPHVRLGRRIVIPRETLSRWLLREAEKSTAPTAGRLET